MEKELIIKIDLEKITEDILEKETYSSGVSTSVIIQNRVKDEIKRNIQNSIVDEIKRNINIEELKEKSYSSEYLKRTANDILQKELSGLVKNYTDEWIKKQMRYVVEDAVRKNVEEFVLPKLQKMISNLIIVNQENIDEELQELQKGYEEQIKELK